MSTFEDIETQNARRFWGSFERVEATERATRLTRRDMRGRARGVEVDPLAVVCLPPRREPRTALHLLGPWAPKLGPVRVEHNRFAGRFRWTREAETCEHPDERCEGMPGGKWRCRACGYRGPAGAP